MHICFYLFGSTGLSCSLWDLLPRQRLEPRPPALGAQSLSHWTTRDVPKHTIFLKLHFKYLIMRFIQIYPFLCLKFQPWWILSVCYSKQMLLKKLRSLWDAVGIFPYCILCGTEQREWPVLSYLATEWHPNHLVLFLNILAQFSETTGQRGKIPYLKCWRREICL